MTRAIYEKAIFHREQQMDRKVYDRARNVLPTESSNAGGQNEQGGSTGGDTQPASQLVASCDLASAWETMMVAEPTLAEQCLTDISESNTEYFVGISSATLTNPDMIYFSPSGEIPPYIKPTNNNGSFTSFCEMDDAEVDLIFGQPATPRGDGFLPVIGISNLKPGIYRAYDGWIEDYGFETDDEGRIHGCIDNGDGEFLDLIITFGTYEILM